MLGGEGARLSDDELDRIAELIEKAKKEVADEDVADCVRRTRVVVSVAPPFRGGQALGARGRDRVRGGDPSWPVVSRVAAPVRDADSILRV